MKIVRKTIRKITYLSAAAGIIFLVASILIFLTDPTLDYMIIVAFTIAVVPPGIASILHGRWKGKIEKALPEFLRDLATSFRTGMPLQVALEHASNRKYGPLTLELKTMVAHMSWGMNFNDALTEFSERIDLPVVKKGTVLILEAGKHGGDLSNIFDSTAKYVDNVNAWTDRRRMQTLPYVAIFYFSVAIFLFIIIIIYNMIFMPINEMGSSGMGLINPLFGGVIAGKINEDSFLGGFKHAAVLAVVSGVAFYLFFA
jgi:flagellar protein FlaJ